MWQLHLFSAIDGDVESLPARVPGVAAYEAMGRGEGGAHFCLFFRWLVLFCVVELLRNDDRVGGNLNFVLASFALTAKNFATRPITGRPFSGRKSVRTILF